MKPRVLIVQRRMTEYRVPLFERLRNSLDAAGIALGVVQGTPSSREVARQDGADLEWATSVKCTYLALGALKPFVQRLPRSLVAAQNLVILPHENWMVANNLRLLFRRPPDRLLAFWGHGANFQAGKWDWGPERIKAKTARMADWWFAYTDASVERLRSVGFPSERITCLNNAVDTGLLHTYRQEIEGGEIDALRRQLGLRGTTVAVFIGSLHNHKRLGFLLEAADLLRARLPSFELVVVGDGPLRPMVRSYASSREWIKVVGPRHGRDKVAHAALGSVLLNPGMVGLGILDSFALGLPMVTTDCRLHSPEIAYLRPGANGLMTADDPDSYVSEVLSLLADPERLALLARGCRQDAARYTVDAMADNFADGILRALGSSG
jgi:glycosyltransferase involved in cell wall biosynthesis